MTIHPFTKRSFARNYPNKLKDAFRRRKEPRLNDPPDEEPRVLIEILPGKSPRREVALWS